MECLHNVLHDSSLFVRLSVLFFFFPVAICKMEVLTDQNWTAILEGDWFVEFYAPWCGACRSFEPIWLKFSESSEKLGVNIGKADITIEKGLAGRFMVTQLPTLYYINANGQQFRHYVGKRRLDNLEAFIKNQEWKSIDPLAWYMKPNSIPMAVTAVLAEHAESVRLLVNHIVDEYGVPMWLIIVGMVVATVVIGIMLGLLLVFVLDQFFGTKKKPVRGAVTKKSGSPSHGLEPSEEREPTATKVESSDTKKDK